MAPDPPLPRVWKHGCHFTPPFLSSCTKVSFPCRSTWCPCWVCLSVFACEELSVERKFRLALIIHATIPPTQRMLLLGKRSSWWGHCLLNSVNDYTNHSQQWKRGLFHQNLCMFGEYRHLIFCILLNLERFLSFGYYVSSKRLTSDCSFWISYTSVYFTGTPYTGWLNY